MDHHKHNHKHLLKAPDDIVSTYHKHRAGTIELGVPKKWLALLEEQILLFFGKLFGIKGFDKPLKDLNNQVLDLCVLSPNVKEAEVVLFKIANMLNQLNETKVSQTMPLLANLLCMTKHDFRHVKTSNAKKIVMKFQDKINDTAYTTLEEPEVRLAKLMDIVDGIRKYSEYLLQADGYSLKSGYSPREILRVINQVRNDNSIIPT